MPDNIIEFPPSPPEAPVTITLTGEEWFAIAMRLAGRPTDIATAFRAEAKMLQQLEKGTP